MKSMTLRKSGVVAVAMIVAIAAVAILAGCSKDGTGYQRNNEGGRGNRSYLDSTALELEEGKSATATGYIVDEEMTVTRMSVDGDPPVALRSDDGTPLWAGRGRAQSGGSAVPAEPRSSQSTEGNQRSGAGGRFGGRGGAGGSGAAKPGSAAQSI